MKKLGLYTTDVKEIQKRVEKSAVSEIFEKRVV